MVPRLTSFVMCALQEHYSISWGVNDKLGILEGFGFQGIGSPDRAPVRVLGSVGASGPFAYID